MKNTKTHLAGAALVVRATLVAALLGVASASMADSVTLCGNLAVVGGFGNNATAVAGTHDASCGSNSAVQVSIAHATDYGKLSYTTSTAGYPAGLTLGTLTGLSADMTGTSAGTQPFFMLSFTDSTQGLGQANAANQILLIEFETATLSGNELNADPNSTLFNLYDNTAGNWLMGGQQDARTMAAWFSGYSFLSGEALGGIFIGEGLAGGDDGPRSMTLNALTINAEGTVPEPASLALVGLALAGLGYARRRKA